MQHNCDTSIALKVQSNFGLTVSKQINKKMLLNLSLPIQEYHQIQQQYHQVQQYNLQSLVMEK